MSAPGPVDAVLFDLGGVITASPFEHMADYARGLGLDPAVLGHIGRIGPATELMARCETGEVTMAEYMDEMARLVAAEHGSAISGPGLWNSMLVCVDPLPEAVALVREVHRNHRTGLITNAATDIRSMWRARLDPALFDVIVDSSEVRMRKPEPEIYRHALDLVGCPAERAVFVDDQPVNVEAATALGMRGVVFESQDQMRRELAELGVRIEREARDAVDQH